MLNINKSIQITGQSIIDGKQVVSMNANITTQGDQAPNVNKTIIDKDLYSKHLKECRADIKAFETEAYKIEDEFIGGTK